MPAPVAKSDNVELGSVYPFFADEQRVKFAAFISGLNGDEGYAGKAEKLIQSKDFYKLCKSFVSESKHLLKVTEAELEPLFYLLVAFLQQLPLAEFESLAIELAKVIEEDENLELAVAKIKVLTHLYNALPVASSSRCGVYLCLIRAAEKGSQLELVIPTISELDEWLKQWSITPDQRRAVYNMWGRTLSKMDSKYENLAYLQFLNYLATFKEVPRGELPQEVKEVTMLTVELALKVPSVFNFEFLVSNPIALHYFGRDPIWQLLQLFVSGKTKDWNAWVAKKENAALLKSYKLDAEQLEHKIRLLTLATICGEALANPNASVPYKDVAEELSISMDQVERWVIEAIRCNLIMARLDQLESKLQVQRTTFRNFNQQEWTLLAERLSNWSRELSSITQVIENSRLM